MMAVTFYILFAIVVGGCGLLVCGERGVVKG